MIIGTEIGHRELMKDAFDYRASKSFKKIDIDVYQKVASLLYGEIRNTVHISVYLSIRWSILGYRANPAEF